MGCRGPIYPADRSRERPGRSRLSAGTALSHAAAVAGRRFESRSVSMSTDMDRVPGGGFSLEAPEGMRFLSRGRASDEENRLLAEHPPLVAADYAWGERPPQTGPQIVAKAGDACPVPAGRASKA